MSFAKYNLSDYNIAVDLDYVSNQYKASLINPFTTGSTTSKVCKIFDGDGTILKVFNLTSQSAGSISLFAGSGSFDSVFSQNDGGYDTSIARQDNSGVYASYAETNWHLSSDFPLAVIAEDSLLSNLYIIADRRVDNNLYSGIPVLITRGDAVTQGVVSSVTDSNFVTLTYDRQLGSYTGQNITDCIGTVISGASLGENFAVRSHTIGQSGFYVDIDATHLSGQLVKLQPYRTVNAYSGWTYTGSNSSNLGDFGLKARFGVTPTIPIKAGSIHYTSGTYSGTTTIYHPYDPAQTPIVTASVVALKSDTYRRTLEHGDVVYFNPASAPSATATGMIVSVTTGHGVPSEGDFAITYWPAREPAAASEYQIHRCNTFTLMHYPKPDRDYLLAVRDVDGTATGEKYVTSFHTPGIDMDISANQYESQFPDISETSNFHIGPVYLTNGQTIKEDNVDNGVSPRLKITAELLQGDPTNPTVVFNKTAFSTQNADAAHKFNGMYFKDGILTIGTSAVFNASETLICKATATYGSINVTKVFTIPVQPSV